jgi:hypothetical protein
MSIASRRQVPDLDSEEMGRYVFHAPALADSLPLPLFRAQAFQQSEKLF